MIRRTPSRGSGSCPGSSSLCVSNPRTVFPHCAANRAQGKATSGAMRRVLTGLAHAGYAALHVREMLSHGDRDPLQTHSIRAIDGNRGYPFKAGQLTYDSRKVFHICWASQRACPNSYRLMNSPITRSCLCSVLDKQIVRRINPTATLVEHALLAQRFTGA